MSQCKFKAKGECSATAVEGETHCMKHRAYRIGIEGLQQILGKPIGSSIDLTTPIEKQKEVVLNDAIAEQKKRL